MKPPSQRLSWRSRGPIRATARRLRSQFNFERLEDRIALNAAPIANSDSYIVDYQTSLSVEQPAVNASTYGGLTEITSIPAEFQVLQVEFAQHAGLLFVRDTPTTVRIFDAVGGMQIETHIAKEEFVDFDLTPDGRYLYLTDFGGQTSLGMPIRPSWIHRYDTETRQWEVKQAPQVAFHIEMIDSQRFALLDGVRFVFLTLNDFGSSPAAPITEVHRQQVELGDIEYDHRTNVLYVSTTTSSWSRVKAFQVDEDSIDEQSGSPLLSPLPNELVLSADGRHLFIGYEQFSPADLSTVQFNYYRTAITASTAGIAFSTTDVFSAATGERIGAIEGPATSISASDDGVHVIVVDGAVNHVIRLYQVRPLGWGILANDRDDERDPLTATLNSGPAHGTLALHADGSFEYTPDLGFYGRDSFSYTASDGIDNSDVATVDLIVVNPNLNPVPDSFSAVEDTILDTPPEQGVLSNDTGPALQNLSAVLTEGTHHGNLTLHLDGSFRYTPQADFFGNDSFSYRMSDGITVSTVSTVTISVSPVPEAPVAVSESYATHEDVVFTSIEEPPSNLIGVAYWPQNGHYYGILTTSRIFSSAVELAESTVYRGVSGHLATITSQAEQTFLEQEVFSQVPSSRPWIGMIDDDPRAPNRYRWITGEDITYTHWWEGYPANYSGDDPVLVDTATGKWLNNSNLFGNNRYSLVEFEGRFLGSVLDNDTDVDGDALHAVLVSGPQHGTLQLNLDGTFVYLPNADFFGADQFTYKASDGTLESNPTTVVIDVAPVPDVPIGAPESYSVAEDAVLDVAVAAGVLQNDRDVDLGPFRAVLVTRPNFGQLTLNDDGSFHYVPNANFYGADFFVYRAQNASAASERVRVSITVTDTFDPPTANDDNYTTPEDTELVVDSSPSLSYTTLAGSFNDLVYDSVGDRIFASVANSNTVVAINPYVPRIDSTIVVGVNPNQLAISDNGKYLYVSLEGPRTIRRINLETMTADQEFPVWVQGSEPWIAADIEVFPGQPNTIAVAVYRRGVSSSQNGFIKIYDNGVPRPGRGALGDDVVEINNDGSDVFGFDTETTPSSLHRYELVGSELISAVTKTGSVTAFTPNIEWAVGKIYADSGQIFDATTLNEVGRFGMTGQVVVDPTVDRVYFRRGAEIRAYVMSSGQAAGTIFVWEIIGNNRSIVRFGQEGLAYLITDKLVLVNSDVISGNSYRGVLHNDQDDYRKPLAAVLVTPPEHGTVTLNADGTFAYRPALNYFGDDEFTYKVRDGAFETPPATVSLRIDPVDDPPAGSTDQYYYVGGQLSVPTAQGVLANDLDVEGAPLTASLVENGQYGQVQLNTDGSFVYTAGPTYVGRDRFTYRANDGSLDSPVTTVSIVAPVRVIANDVNIALPVGVATEGHFDIYLKVAAGFPFSVAGYEADLRLPVGAGVELVEATPSADPHPSIFPTQPASQVLADGLLVSDSISMGQVPLEDGDGLFRVRFTIASDWEGTSPLMMKVDATNLFNESGTPVPIERVAGNITVKRLPGAVASVAANAVGPNKIRLSWEDLSTNETGFKIERFDGAEFVEVGSVGANVTTFDDVNLQSSLSYSYRVHSFNGAGDGPVSQTINAQTPTLSIITGSIGNDSYQVIRSGSMLRVYENTSPDGVPNYSSALADMPVTLTIDALGGNDSLIVNTGGEASLGIERLVYNAGIGSNTLTLQSGSARIDSDVPTGGSLGTTVQSGAHLQTARLLQNGLTLSGNSKVTLLPSGGTSKVTSLNVSSAGATLDITNNAIVVDYSSTSPIATIRQRLTSGRGGVGLGKGWSGAGITSSTVSADNASAANSTSVGFVENVLLPLGAYGNFRGVPVDATSVLIAYTRTGDANLDGVVDDDDVTILGANYAPGVPKPAWALGDFDYNGFVDDDDVTLLGAFYNPGAAALTLPSPGGRAVSAAPLVKDGAESAVSGEAVAVVSGKGQSTKYEVHGTKIIARTTATAKEILGGSLVRGRETGAEQDMRGRETSAERKRADHERLIDLLAEAVVGNRFHAEDRIIRTRGEIVRQPELWK